MLLRTLRAKSCPYPAPLTESVPSVDVSGPDPSSRFLSQFQHLYLSNRAGCDNSLTGKGSRAHRNLLKQLWILVRVLFKAPKILGF